MMDPIRFIGPGSARVEELDELGRIQSLRFYKKWGAQRRP